MDALAGKLKNLLAASGEHACQLAVYRDGGLVCDLAAGAATPETIFPLFSAGKGPMITAVLRLVERGEVDLDRPVAEYWPEFGVNGKEAITLRTVLNHRAGLFSLPASSFAEQADWEFMCSALAARRPVGVPGTRTRYHALTFAWLVGECCRRATGRDFKTIITDEVLRPAGIADEFSYGISAADEWRTLPVHHAPEAAEEWIVKFIGDEAIRRGFLPSANAFGTARALARHYMLLLRGDLVGRDMLDEAITPVERGADDPVRGWERFGLGYILLERGAFGHAGMLGAEGFAVPELGLAVGFATDTLGAAHPVRDRISELLGIPPRRW